ncbi:MAG: response regulator transcription factor [Deltaproteobacteria bacterium]|nr:response regulator transcription factor [Deltaproteobacteria bacterium]
MTSSKILIADDDIAITMHLEELFAEKGYILAGIAFSGEEAILLAQKHHPIVVIMDVKMPGKLDGIETAQKLRHEMNIPVIFLSGHDDYALIQRAKRVYPLSFLLKPVKERQILAELELALFKIKSMRERQLFTLDTFPGEVPDRYSNLTPTEIRVAGLVRKGKTSKEAAQSLNVSESTIQWHRKNIRKKLKLVNTEENLTINLLY